MFSRKRKEVYNIFRSSTSRTCKWYDMQKVTYKIKLIDSVKFMASSLWNLPDNVSEGLQKSKCIDSK